jgi:hypothetical protein
MDEADDDFWNEIFFIEFIPDKQYVSPKKRCEAEYSEAYDVFQRTAGALDVRMKHEYLPEHILQESGYTEESTINGVRVSGRDKLDALLMAMEIINERKFQLSERQMTILNDTYFVACLEKIFGDELTANIDYIMKKFNIDELFEDVFIMMQRRGGKTIVTAVFCGCFQMTQVSGNINVYGKSKRVTKMMKNIVKEIYYTLKDSKKFEPSRVVEDNDERFAVETRFGTVNVCNFFPCNSEVRSFFSFVPAQRGGWFSVYFLLSWVFKFSGLSRVGVVCFC